MATNVPRSSISVNPYQAPATARATRSRVQPTPQVPALHGDRSIAMATFVGGVISGSVLFARNLWLLGRTAAALTAVALAVVWQGLLSGIALSLPWDVPLGIWMIVGVTHTLVFQQMAKATFRNSYAQIADGHGRLAHWGLAVVLTTATLVLTISILLIVAVLVP
jgi:hypothetical protein